MSVQGKSKTAGSCVANPGNEGRQPVSAEPEVRTRKLQVSFWILNGNWEDGKRAGVPDTPDGIRQKGPTHSSNGQWEERGSWNQQTETSLTRTMGYPKLAR